MIGAAELFVAGFLTHVDGQVSGMIRESPRTRELVSRWLASGPSRACDHDVGLSLASALTGGLWCVQCSVARDHVSRWLGHGSCAGCGRYLGSERNAGVLAIGDVALFASCCASCALAILGNRP